MHIPSFFPSFFTCFSLSFFGSPYPDGKGAHRVDRTPEACPVYEVIDSNPNLSIKRYESTLYVRIINFPHTMHCSLSTLITSLAGNKNINPIKWENSISCHHLNNKNELSFLIYSLSIYDRLKCRKYSFLPDTPQMHGGHEAAWPACFT